MAITVAEVMSRDPVTVSADTPISEAARIMRAADAGDVREACSGAELATVTPDTRIEEAVQLMRSKAIRRLPVVEGNRPVGIVSIGDLAIERDEDSALADISAARSNQ